MGRAQTIVVPNAYAEMEGPAENITPGGDISGVRDMVMFDASQFGALSGPSYLTRVSYRANGTMGPSGPNTVTMQLFASTTSKTVPGRSMTFEENLGPDALLVFDGPLQMATANLPGPENTRQFDITFEFTTPFLYNPAAGNLLLDFRISEAHGSAIGWDAVSGSSVVGSISAIGSPTAATGSPGHQPVTQFIFEATPRVSIRTSQIEVCWDSTPNLAYRVEWRSELAPEVWIPLADCVQASEARTCISDTLVEGAPQRFYRVVRTECVPLFNADGSQGINPQ